MRVLSRFVGLVWALLLAAFALGIALYCLDGAVSLGAARPDRLLHLTTARTETGRFLDQLQAPGHVAILSLLCGVAAVIAGLALLRGLLAPPRERIAVLEHDPSGNLGARRRALAQMLGAIAGYPAEIREVDRVKVRLKRRGSGGRVTLDAIRELDSDESSAKRSLGQALDPVAEPFGLRARVRTRLPGAGHGDTS